jgi:predicted metalloprotease with PDZ domain
MKTAKTLSLTYSLGLAIGKGAKISAVVWDGPAFKAGLTVGQEIVAVNGTPYTDDAMNDAVTAAKGGTAPIRLTVKTDTRVRDIDVRWNGGHRYPKFEKIGTGDGALDKLLAAR